MKQDKRPESYIIFPLDVPTEKEAVRYAKMLSGAVGVFKIGLELFTRCGPDIVRAVSQTSPAQIFLDLKFHDIPATVSRAVLAVADLGAAFLTVHCGDSLSMLESAVAAASGKMRLLGVTLLTSISPNELQNAGYAPSICQDAGRLVLARAAMAQKAGCAGVICSGLEARRIKAAFGRHFLAVTPGVRPVWENHSRDDQARIVTPGRAIREGADYIVVGRPIRDASDPVSAARRIAEEIQAAMKSISP